MSDTLLQGAGLFVCSVLTAFQLRKHWKPPAKIEALFASTAGNMFAGINRATSGARQEVPLPRGKASFQVYSIATPNGQKVGIMCEELGIDYDAHVIGLGGDQFGSGFVAVNPNSKIPAAIDYDGPGGKSIRLFESASICWYLAEKHRKFLPTDPALRAECMNWVMWQMGGQGKGNPREIHPRKSTLSTPSFSHFPLLPHLPLLKDR